MEQGCLQPEVWAEENFGAAELGDKRRTRRLVKSAIRAAQLPGGSLPQMMQDPAALDGFYRLVNQEDVTHASVIAAHTQRTRQLMSGWHNTVLILKDITELDFSTHKSLKKIGQIGNGNGSGYLCHNSLAIDACTKEVLGLADQRLFIRPRVPKNETTAQRRRRLHRQSRLWVQSSDAVGTPPPGQRWLEVCDREADTFEYLHNASAHGRFFVVRSKSNRNVVYEENGQQCSGKLHTYVRTLAEAKLASGERDVVHVPAKEARAATKKKPAMPAQPARSAEVAVSFCKVWIKPPRGQRRGQELLALWVVRIWEVNPPAGAEPVEWILLTNVEISSAEDAAEIGGWYECRWVVEDYHKGQKTGCRIEDPQFEKEERLEPTIAFLSIVAVLLLQLRGLSRSADTKDRPALDYLPKVHVLVLSQWRWPNQALKLDMTVAEFFLAMARLGGHQNRKQDGPPGWIVLWRGWTQLQARVSAVQAMAQSRCGET